MATFEQIEILMTEVGPVLDPLSIDAIAEENSWVISLREDLGMLVQFDEPKNCLVLATEVGSPPAGDRTALYEILLQVNYHWETTGGNRMAISGPSGEGVQVFEIGADGLDATRLSGIIASFADAALAWREIVQRKEPAQRNSLDGYANIGIRV